MINFFGRRNRINDPDSAWKIQNREFQCHPLYRLVDMKDGGKLVNAFREGGKAKLIQMLKEEVEPLLYNRGKGGIITKIDFLRWKHNYHLKMVVSWLLFSIRNWMCVINDDLLFLILRLWLKNGWILLERFVKYLTLLLPLEHLCLSWILFLIQTLKKCSTLTHKAWKNQR